jgi:hypothetical protein
MWSFAAKMACIFCLRAFPGRFRAGILGKIAVDDIELFRLDAFFAQAEPESIDPVIGIEVFLGTRNEEYPAETVLRVVVGHLPGPPTLSMRIAGQCSSMGFR